MHHKRSTKTGLHMISCSDNGCVAWKPVPSPFFQWLLALRSHKKGQPKTAQPSLAVQIRGFTVYMPCWHLSSKNDYFNKMKTLLWLMSGETLTSFMRAGFSKLCRLGRNSTPSYWLFFFFPKWEDIYLWEPMYQGDAREPWLLVMVFGVEPLYLWKGPSSQSHLTLV